MLIVHFFLSAEGCFSANICFHDISILWCKLVPYVFLIWLLLLNVRLLLFLLLSNASYNLAVIRRQTNKVVHHNVTRASAYFWYSSNIFKNQLLSFLINFSYSLIVLILLFVMKWIDLSLPQKNQLGPKNLNLCLNTKNILNFLTNRIQFVLLCYPT
jgi:hypothetical protein